MKNCRNPYTLPSSSLTWAQEQVGACSCLSTHPIWFRRVRDTSFSWHWRGIIFNLSVLPEAGENEVTPAPLKGVLVCAWSLRTWELRQEGLKCEVSLGYVVSSMPARGTPSIKDYCHPRFRLRGKDYCDPWFQRVWVISAGKGPQISVMELGSWACSSHRWSGRMKSNHCQALAPGLLLQQVSRSTSLPK